jgi:hypothetical protein
MTRPQSASLVLDLFDPAVSQHPKLLAPDRLAPEETAPSG